MEFVFGISEKRLMAKTTKLKREKFHKGWKSDGPYPLALNQRYEARHGEPVCDRVRHADAITHQYKPSVSRRVETACIPLKPVG